MAGRREVVDLYDAIETLDSLITYINGIKCTWPNIGDRSCIRRLNRYGDVGREHDYCPSCASHALLMRAQHYLLEHYRKHPPGPKPRFDSSQSKDTIVKAVQAALDEVKR